MTQEIQKDQAPISQEAQAPKQNDKEYNFAQIRQQLERERNEKAALEQELEKTKRLAQERLSPSQEDDDHYDEPYVDPKYLEKKLAKFGSRAKQETEEKINNAVQKALAEERKNGWLKSNPDFYDVMQHAQKLADNDPELAETILAMPDTFERQKLVYKNIKALGIHNPPEEKKSGIQEKIQQNQRNPYYQPSGVAAAPYGMMVGGKNYSESEGKQAFSKMKELQKRLGIM